MNAVSREDLEALYEHSTDPWHFRTSDYERCKYRATIGALQDRSYGTILEIGCGNGELARLLQRRCSHYLGVDAVQTALVEARKAVPSGQFSQIYLPDTLPECEPDLILLSEILYFLDEGSIALLAGQIADRWSYAELLVVNMLGATGNHLSGEQALGSFIRRLGDRYGLDELSRTEFYRIDRLHVCREEVE